MLKTRFKKVIQCLVIRGWLEPSYHDRIKPSHTEELYLWFWMIVPAEKLFNSQDHPLHLWVRNFLRYKYEFIL